MSRLNKAKWLRMRVERWNEKRYSTVMKWVSAWQKVEFPINPTLKTMMKSQDDFPVQRPGNSMWCFGYHQLTSVQKVVWCATNQLSIIGSDNGLSPRRHQAIIWTNDGILLIGPLRTKYSEIMIEIHTFSFKQMLFKMLCGKRRPFCPSLNVLKQLWSIFWHIHTSLC